MLSREIDYRIVDIRRCLGSHSRQGIPIRVPLRIQHPAKVKRSHGGLIAITGLRGWAAELGHGTPGRDYAVAARPNGSLASAVGYIGRSPHGSGKSTCRQPCYASCHGSTCVDATCPYCESGADASGEATHATPAAGREELRPSDAQSRAV